MRMTTTLFAYISRLFFAHFLALFFILLAVVYLIDTVELLRRAGNHPDISFGLVAQLSFLKLPEVGQELFTFAVLFSAIFTFWHLTRRHELAVMRSAGFSAWQFILPALAGAICIGIIKITVLSPVSAALLSRYETLENLYLKGKTSHVTVSENGLWLRQGKDDGYIIIHSQKVDAKSWELGEVIVLFFDTEDALQFRIDSRAALLREGYWDLQNAVINRPGQGPEKISVYRLPTEMTAQKIEESFASPATLSFWHIPAFIKTLEETGFSATRLRMHYQALLAQPLLFSAMILLAAAVSMRPPRQQGTLWIITAGILIGFFIFFLDSFLHAFGVSQKLPVYLAAWIPAVVSFLLGIAVILHLEDG